MEGRHGSGLYPTDTDPLVALPSAYTPEVCAAALQWATERIDTSHLARSCRRAFLALTTHGEEGGVEPCVLDGRSRACALELLLAAAPRGSHFIAAPLDHTGRTLLHAVASGGCHPERWDDMPEPLPAELMQRMVGLLVACGAHLETRDRMHGATPLAWACWFGCGEGARAL
jgi:hypothetical protein